jgi:hypothetical protein
LAPQVAPAARVNTAAFIRGLVVTADGVPAASANILIEPTAPAGSPQAVVSTADGAFTAGPLTPGLYALEASSGDMVSDRLTGVVVNGADAVSGIRLVLIPGASLEATVRDGLSGHTVDACVAAALGRTVSCDHAGRVMFRPLSQGDLALRVTAPGYAAQEMTVSITQRVPLKVDVLLERGGKITGIVVDPNDKPVPGASVRSAHYAMKSPKPAEVETSALADGTFVLDGVVSGLVGVRASAPGYAEASAPETNLKPGQTRTGVQLRLTAGGAIAGVVQTPEGKPAPGARVEATRLADHVVVGGDTSGADGSFRFDGLGEGDYTLTAESLLGHGVAPGVKVTGRDETSITILLGDDAIDGLVHDPAGKPVSGAAVTAYSSFGGGRSGQSAVTGNDGKFKIAGLCGPPYRVEAHGNDKGTAEVRGVPAGGHVEIELTGAGRIVGTVAAQGGHPADNFDVKIVPQKSERGASVAGRYRAVRVVSPDGAFRFEDVPPGHYDVVASARGRLDAHTSASVPAGETVEVTLLLGEGASVSGHVMEQGSPVADCVVGDGAVSDSGGSYEVTGVSEGRVTLSARCPDGSSGAATVTISGGSSATADIEVHPGGDQSGHPSQDFGGVGAALKPGPNGNVVVNSVFEGGPAFMAGLQDGDQIAAVNGQPINGQSINDVIQQIRGPIGMPVVLSVQRAGEDGPVDIYVERDRILVN